MQVKILGMMKNHTLQVIDMLGRKIHEQLIDINQTSGQQKINVSQWQPGNYIIRLSNNTINLEQRAVISR